MVIKKHFICPYCGAEFRPYGAFMLEKIYCPQCGKFFHILKFAQTLRIVYSASTFILLLIAYGFIRPETSIVLTIFWFISLLALKAITYITHYVLLLLWSMRKQ